MVKRANSINDNTVGSRKLYSKLNDLKFWFTYKQALVKKHINLNSDMDNVAFQLDRHIHLGTIAEENDSIP